MSIQLFRKHSLQVWERISKGTQLPQSKHLQKRFNQSDLFRVFTVACPVDSVQQEDQIKTFAEFRASVGIKDQYICSACPLQKECRFAYGKLTSNEEYQFSPNQMTQYMQALIDTSDEKYIALLNAKHAKYNTLKGTSDNKHFIYWGAALRILDTIGFIAQDVEQSKGQLTLSFIEQNVEFDKSIQSEAPRLNNIDRISKSLTGDDESVSNETRSKPSPRKQKDQNEEGPRRPADRFGEQSGETDRRKPYRQNDDFERKPRQERSPRSYEDRDRPQRSFEERGQRAERPSRTFEERPQRTFEERPQRSFENRPPRQYGERSGSRDDFKERSPRPDYKARDGGNFRGNEERPAYRGDRPSYQSENRSGGDRRSYAKKETNDFGEFQEELNDYQKIEKNPKFKKEFIRKFDQESTEEAFERPKRQVRTPHNEEEGDVTEKRKFKPESNSNADDSYKTERRVKPDDMLMRESDEKREGGRAIKRGSLKFTRTV